MQNYLLAVVIALPLLCFAGADEQAGAVARLPMQARTAAGFAPAGWRVEQTLAGDINGDRIDDLVVVLRKTDPANIVNPGERDDAGTFDTNPRVLAIAFGSASGAGYTLQSSDQQLIARPALPEPDGQLWHTFDPLVGVALNHGILTVRLRDGNERDWGAQKFTYQYRFEHACMRLIRMDQIELPTCKGCDGRAYSINYVSGKAQHWPLSKPRQVLTEKAVAPQQACLGAS